MAAFQDIGHRQSQGGCELLAHAAAELLEGIELLAAPQPQSAKPLALVVAELSHGAIGNQWPQIAADGLGQRFAIAAGEIGLGFQKQLLQQLVGFRKPLEALVITMGCLQQGPGLLGGGIGILIADAVAALLGGATLINELFDLTLQRFQLLLQVTELMLVVSTAECGAFGL